MLRLSGTVAVGLLGLALVGAGPTALAQDATTLRARQSQLGEALAHSSFQRPLVLESVESSSALQGDVYAVVEQSFSVVQPALQTAPHWCELLMLHLNVKGCAASATPAGDHIELMLGRKFDQPLEQAYHVEFSYAAVAVTPQYLRVQMYAASGPLNTHDYRLALEAIPMDGTRSFLHMTYSYGFGLAARIAMQGYLATIGRDKVGFTVVGQNTDGSPVLIDGVRSVVERNTMRYYLAVEAYLGATATPPAQRSDKRLTDWFNAVERYPQQLHEIERVDYMDMKHREIERQQSTAK